MARKGDKGSKFVNYGDEIDYDGTTKPATRKGSPSAKTQSTYNGETTNGYGPIRPTKNKFILKFYEIASLQGRVSYFLLSFYIINPRHYDSWFGDTILYPYLLANCVYGYIFVIFTRIHFMTMPILPRMLWSFMGSMMFTYSSLLTFEWIARHWGAKSPNRKVYIATLLSFLYGRVYAGAFLSYLSFVDNKLLSFVRRVYGPGFD
ncbi:uncharacterized protein LOC123298552 [Chrysoperla carnea]|uniref:uncharacterized protein LOC123298552 n=1 Tax=Chrysoperla carnea TaxID=189513 RepID=UPI001D0645DA|nr:uncharacterized protein LOC123298552 [Chrysoperla carnea]